MLWFSFSITMCTHTLELTRKHTKVSFRHAMELGILLLNTALPPFQCQLSDEESICLPVYVQNEIYNLVSVCAYKAESCVDLRKCHFRFKLKFSLVSLNDCRHWGLAMVIQPCMQRGAFAIWGIMISIDFWTTRIPTWISWLQIYQYLALRKLLRNWCWWVTLASSNDTMCHTYCSCVDGFFFRGMTWTGEQKGLVLEATRLTDETDKASRFVASALVFDLWSGYLCTNKPTSWLFIWLPFHILITMSAL